MKTDKPTRVTSARLQKAGSSDAEPGKRQGSVAGKGTQAYHKDKGESAARKAALKRLEGVDKEVAANLIHHSNRAFSTPRNGGKFLQHAPSTHERRYVDARRGRQMQW